MSNKYFNGLVPTNEIFYNMYGRIVTTMDRLVPYVYISPAIATAGFFAFAVYQGCKEQPADKTPVAAQAKSLEKILNK